MADTAGIKIEIGFECDAKWAQRFLKGGYCDRIIMLQQALEREADGSSWGTFYLGQPKVSFYELYPVLSPALAAEAGISSEDTSSATGGDTIRNCDGGSPPVSS